MESDFVTGPVAFVADFDAEFEAAQVLDGLEFNVEVGEEVVAVFWSGDEVFHFLAEGEDVFHAG